MKPDGKALPPPPLPNICELCKKNPVPLGHVRAGGPVAFMCCDCEKIVAEWERRKKAHHASLSKLKMGWKAEKIEKKWEQKEANE